MTHRALLVTLFATSATAASLVLACSSKEGAGFDPDGTDAAADVATTPDSTNSGRDGGDAGPGSRADSGSGNDSGGATGGRCSPLTGECDLVLQDCPPASGAARECVAVRLQDGGVTAACVAVSATKSIQKGYPCCSAPDGTDSCVGGLTCVGGESCTDGGAPTGRCSPRCCVGDDGICGSDSVSGASGRCSLTIVGDKVDPQYRVCSYANICRPFGVTPCSQGHVCVVTDTSGTATCSQIFAPNGGTGATFGRPCAAANGCVDGLACLSTGDAGLFCEYMCHVPATTTPFDAGALTTEPGKGGCPATKPTCRAVPNLYPGWLGVCQ